MADSGLTEEVEWCGSRITTLKDLLRPALRAWIVGINPTVKSVGAGHYYQGRLGTRVWNFLERSGALSAPASGRFHDEEMLSRHLGLTDLVKRPTASAAELSPADFEFGIPKFLAKLGEFPPRLLAFPFKEAAERLVGPLPPRTWGATGATVEGIPVFLLPIAYQPKAVMEEARKAFRSELDRTQ